MRMGVLYSYWVVLFMLVVIRKWLFFIQVEEFISLLSLTLFTLYKSVCRISRLIISIPSDTKWAMEVKRKQKLMKGKCWWWRFQRSWYISYRMVIEINNHCLRVQVAILKFIRCTFSILNTFFTPYKSLYVYYFLRFIDHTFHTRATIMFVQDYQFLLKKLYRNTI